MIYSKFYLKDKGKIPTYLAILSTLLLVILLNKIFSPILIPSRAAKLIVRRVEVTNMSSTQVAIFWQTDDKGIGWIAYGEDKNNLNKIIFDERDSENKKNPYSNHYVILRNLKENSQYFFKLINNDRVITNTNGEIFGFKTLPNVYGTSGIKPVYGKVNKKNGEALDNAVVLLFIGNAYPLSILTQASGGWLISLNHLVDINSQKLKIVNNQDKVKLEFYSEDGDFSTVIANLPNLSPLPQTIIIGKNYDFSSSNNNVLSTADQKNIKAADTTAIDIIFPKENAIIPAESPLIKGNALPNSEVTIIVNSKNSFSIKTKAGGDGIWRADLPSSLSPGEHTITMITKNNGGEEVRLIRKFVIIKSGERVQGVATGAATPTTTPTVFLTPSPTSSGQIISPTMQVTGNSSTILFLSSASIIILGLGIILAF